MAHRHRLWSRGWSHRPNMAQGVSQPQGRAGRTPERSGAGDSPPASARGRPVPVRSIEERDGLLDRIADNATANTAIVKAQPIPDDSTHSHECPNAHVRGVRDQRLDWLACRRALDPIQQGRCLIRCPGRGNDGNVAERSLRTARSGQFSTMMSCTTAAFACSGRPVAIRRGNCVSLSGSWHRTSLRPLHHPRVDRLTFRARTRKPSETPMTLSPGRPSISRPVACGC